MTTQIERSEQIKTTAEEWNQTGLLVKVHFIVEHHWLSAPNHPIEDHAEERRIPCHVCGGGELSASLCAFCWNTGVERGEYY